MRNISTHDITKLISRLVVQANVVLRPDIIAALKKAARAEKNLRAKRHLNILIENAEIAKKKHLPVCQDTGLTAVFIEIGQDVHITGGSLRKAVDDGVRLGSERGALRLSVVKSPILRINTGTNTPAILHADIVPGNGFKAAVMPKGFGSENKSVIDMMKPTADKSAIIDFIVKAVKDAGPDACPPYVIGVGIGGTFDEAASLSKRALLRDIRVRNSERYLALLEKEISAAINGLGIGVMGLGGRTTALGVNILAAPTHIAGLPVAVNISCHATRLARGGL